MKCENCGDLATKIYYDSSVTPSPGEIVCDGCFDYKESIGHKVKTVGGVHEIKPDGSVMEWLRSKGY
jgi:hypothetical protein